MVTGMAILAAHVVALGLGSTLFLPVFDGIRRGLRERSEWRSDRQPEDWRCGPAPRAAERFRQPELPEHS